MPYKVNHIHIKSKDPKITAEWFVKAFNVKIFSETNLLIPFVFWYSWLIGNCQKVWVYKSLACVYHKNFLR